MDNLKNKTVKATIWSFLEALGLRGVQFLVGIILARLLKPEQFGLIGMLTIFLAIAQTFLDSGFGPALIQRPVVTQEDTSSVFYFNILIGAVCAGLLCFLAPWIAQFYSQPVLVKLLRLMSLLLVINAFGLVQTALLSKAIDLKTQAKITLIASIFSGITGIILAFHGFGVWSLAIQQLSSAFIRVILLWFLGSWRPSFTFRLGSLKIFFGFGSKLLVSGILNKIFDNIYLIVIGKVFSPSDLGYFTRANNLQQLPSQTLSGIVSRVTFPVFSSIQESDREKLKRGMKKALTSLVLINFPMMIGMAVTARPLVIILLTEKWLPIVGYLQLLCLVGLMFPLHVMNLNVLQAMGRSDLFLRLEIIKKFLIALNIFITWRFGIMAMIAGQVVVSFFSYYFNAYYNGTLISYSVWEQIVDLFPYLIISGIMGSAIYFLGYFPFQSQALLLVGQTFFGGCIYVFLCRILNVPAYMEFRSMIMGFFIKNQEK